MFLPTHWVMEHMRGAKTKIQFQSVSDSKRWQITFQITSEVRQMVWSDSSPDFAFPFKELHLYHFSNAHLTWELYCGLHRKQTSQELRMLSSVTINCQVTMIVMNSGSQLSQL